MLESGMSRAAVPSDDRGEEERFWQRVRAENAALTDEEREAFIHDETLMDDLHDPADDAISIRHQW